MAQPLQAPHPARVVLLGHPVGHSLSPLIQNAAIAAAGVDSVYEALDVPPGAFDEVLARLRASRTAGNVTVPHKERMRAACDVLTQVAERAGAVNTFWFDERNRLIGDNTDVAGFTSAVTALMGARPRDLTIGVYGAGGAASAVLTAVESWPGCTAHVYNRSPERARILCERFRNVARAVDDVGSLGGAHLVVNATSVGLRENDLPIDPGLIAPGTAVLDLVYRRGETEFVRVLRKRGVRAADGIAMLVEQATFAFERWFGQSPDRSVMWRALGMEPMVIPG